MWRISVPTPHVRTSSAIRPSPTWVRKRGSIGPLTLSGGLHVRHAGGNHLHSDGDQNFDLSMFREDRITERVHTQFRVELFNTFNDPTLGIPQTTFTSARFGQGSLTVSTARRIQLGLKVLF